MVLYGITIVTLEEELWVAGPGLLSPFYTKKAVFDRSNIRSAQIFNLLVEKGPEQGYFPELAKSLLIVNFPEQEEAARKEGAAEGLYLNFVGGSRYLGAYPGPQEELEAWMKPQL